MNNIELHERYWETGTDHPEPILDLVNENVVLAIQDSWTPESVTPWVEVKNGRMVVVLAGPELPAIGVPVVRVDLLDELQEFARPYGEWSPRSKEQRGDLVKRAADLRALANEVLALAIEAEEQAKS